jgi:hypothetical protein
VDRRTFLTMSGVGVAGLLLPFGRAIAAEELVVPMDVARKKTLADAAMTAATAAGASYCDVRIGRYLRQFVITREDKVQNVVNTESTGIGVRVLVNGAWGFAATNELNVQGAAKAAQQAATIAKANSKIQARPVQLAKTPGVGEVSWKTPITKNAMEVPIKDKVDLLLGVNAAALAAGGDFVNSMLFLVNEQKYFAFHRRQLHRPGRAPHLGADDGDRDRQGDRQVPQPRRPVLADGHGLRVPRRRAVRQVRVAQRRRELRPVLRHEGRRDRLGEAGPRQAHRRRRSSRASTTSCSIRRTPG